MRFIASCLIALALFAFPCAYDTDRREPQPVSLLVAEALAARSHAVGAQAQDAATSSSGGRSPATPPRT